MAGLTTVTSGGILDGTITNADINASAAIDASKISGLSTDSITEGNTTVECVDTGSNGHITFDTEGNEKMRVDSSGRTLVGLTSGANRNLLQIQGDVDNGANGVGGISLRRGVGLGSIGDGSQLGQLDFCMSDGGVAARIICDAEGSAATNDYPGRLQFETTADGASTPTERMRIDSSGNVGIGATSPAAGLHLGDTPANAGIQLGTGADFTIKREAGTAGIVFNVGSDLNNYQFDVGNSEMMRIDSSGRLLIGATTTYVDTPTGSGGFNAKMYIAGSANNDNGLYMSLWNNSTDYDTIGVPLVISRSKGGTVGTFGALSSGNSIGTISFNGDDGDQFVSAAAIEAAVDGTPGNNDMPGRLVFSTTADGASSPTERMRILNNGTMDLRAATDVFNVLSNAAAGTTNLLIRGGNTATSFTAYTIPFGVYTNGNVVNTNNSYGSISDIKLKENIVDATSQWDDLKALQVRKYNFKQETGQQTHTQIGLIAQEAELVSPGLVSESPDRDEDGNDLGTVTKSVNYSVLYMKAVKALQEAIGRIETLEAKVAALEAAE